jgi:hypothetical protein
LPFSVVRTADCLKIGHGEFTLDKYIHIHYRYSALYSMGTVQHVIAVSSMNFIFTILTLSFILHRKHSGTQSTSIKAKTTCPHNRPWRPIEL